MPSGHKDRRCEMSVNYIYRYKLLLDDLLKHTKPTHMEYDRLRS